MMQTSTVPVRSAALALSEASSADAEFVVGIDEVGRGCWAGPLVAGAVLMGTPISGLDDSKKLSKKKRNILAAEIYMSAIAVGLGWVSAEELDIVGLSEAVHLAMQRALDQITTSYDVVIIDGDINYLSDNPKSSCLIKADSIIPSVSAASIVAKVARDTYMETVANIEYPQYEFDKHVGYGTALHHELLKQHGVSHLHRKSFKPVARLL